MGEKMAASSPDGHGGVNDGWNDPPLLTYNPNVLPVQGQSQRTHLNKRVSFPLSTEATSAQPILTPGDPKSSGMLLSPKDGPPKLAPVHILPPSSSPAVQSPIPLLLPNLSPPVDASSLPPSFANAVHQPPKTETLPELLERLDLDSADALRKYTKKILHEMVDVCKDSIQGRSREDVQTRLGLLDDQWRDDKLSEGAKSKLGSLASALKHNDLKLADSLHLALMVDHISEVSQWMVGVKRLINELKLAQSAPPPSPKKLFSPVSNTASSVDSAVASGDSDAVEDVCIDTKNFSQLKPVLMPEMLVPGLAPQEEQQQEQQQSQESSVDAPLHAEESQGSGEKEDGKEKTDDNRS